VKEIESLVISKEEAEETLANGKKFVKKIVQRLKGRK
jgi:hypothetical protein